MPSIPILVNNDDEAPLNELGLEALQKGIPLPIMLTDGNVIVETIYCRSIAGGANYVNGMPRHLTLVRRFGNTEIRADYEYKENSGECAGWTDF